MILGLVRRSHVAKQLEASGTFDTLTAKAVQCVYGFRSLLHAPMLGPRNVQYAPKTPLIKGVDPSLYVFGYRPRFSSIDTLALGGL